MPQIRLDIFAHLHEAQLRKAEMEAKNRFEKMGQQAGQDLTKGIETASPKMRSAMNSAADAAGDLTRKIRDAAKAQEEYNNAVERGVRIGREMEAQQERANSLKETSTNLENNLAHAWSEQRIVGNAVAAQIKERDELDLKHNATLREIHELEEQLTDSRAGGADNAEQTKQIENELIEVRQRSKRETDDLRDTEWVLGQGRKTLQEHTDNVTVFEKELGDVRQKQSALTRDLENNEKELGRTRANAAKADEDIIKRNDDVERSHRRRDETLRRLIETEGNDRGGIGGRGGGGRGGNNRFGSYGGGPLRGVLPGGARAGAGVYAAAAPLAGDLAMGLVTASQSLAVLPAVATAGAAGLLTLKIGFDGLGQALKDMGDPKKFAKDLADIGPAAQQVALEIQHLTEGPLKDLKAAVEDSLFKGVPEKLHNLTNTLLPSVKQLTTGVGDAFNQMFGNVAGQLTTPESLKSIHEIVNNIVTAFHNLGPAVAPFVDALTKIVQTGSSFLPGFGTSIASVAKSFDDFITKAQQSGALQEFMTKGIEAIKLFASELFTLGQKIYEVFGNKSPDQFKQILDDTVNSLITIGTMLEGLGRAANVFLQALQAIADKVGGYQNLFEIGFGIFLTGKLLTSINLIRDAFAIGLPAAAAEGAGSVTAALAGMTAPAWLMTLLAGGAAAVVGYGAGQDLGNGANIPNSRVPRLDSHGHLDATGTPYGHPWTGGGGGKFDPQNPIPLPNPFNAPPPPGPQEQTWADSANLPPYQPFDVPSVSDTESDSKKKADALASIDPSQFAVNPFAGLPPGAIPPGQPGSQSPGPGSGGQSPGPGSGGLGGSPGKTYGPLQYGTNGQPYQKPGLGYEVFNDDAVLSRIEALTKDGQQLQVSQVELEGLKKSGVATQLELLKAENKVTNDRAAINKDQRLLLQEEDGHWKKVAEDKKSNKLDKLGPGLDADFGIGQGLPGIADNLIRFVATLGMAPILGALDVMSKGADGKGDGGGSGILGFLGARNLANGKSPILGQPLDDGSQGSPFPQPAYPQQFQNQDVPAPASSGTTVAGGNPSIPQPDENAIRSWVQQNFGIPNTFGTGSWENASHSDDGGWHHTGFQGQKHVPSGYGFDFHGSPDQMDSLANWIANNDAKDTLELIHQGAGFDHNREINNGQFGDVYGPDVNAQHLDHVHWATTAPWLQGQGGVPGGDSSLSPDATSSMTGLGPSSSGVVPVFVTNMGGGGLGGPGGGGGASGASGGVTGPASGTKQQAAAEIIRQAQAHGWNRDQTIAALSTGLQESGLSESASGGGGAWHGIFQQDSSYPGRDNMSANIKAFFDRQGTPGPGSDPWKQIFALQQGKPYGPGSRTGYMDEIQSHVPEATNLYNSLAPGNVQAPPGPGQPGLKPGVGYVDSQGNPTGYNPAFGPPGVAPGLPPGLMGGAGESPVLGANPPGGPAGPGAGGPGAPPTPTLGSPPGQPVGRSSGQNGWQPSGGPGLGVGGAPMAALTAAAGMFPGAGQLAQMAMQGINRTIQYAGQLGSIGVKGLMETFLPSGSDLGDPQKSWFGRVAAGLAQARPAEPTSAGKEDQKQAKNRQQQQGQQDPNAQQQQGGPMVNIENFVQAPNRNSQQVIGDLAHASAAGKQTRNQ